MVSRARMETFLALLFLTVVALWQDNVSTTSSTTSTAAKTRTRTKSVVVTNSWLAAASRAEKCNDDLPWQKLSYADRTDCQVRAAHAICAVPALKRPRDNNDDDNNDDNDHSWPIPYQCDGPAYEALEAALRKFVAKPEHAPTWGKRAFGLPAHKRVLFLGNIHVQQMAASMACQLASDDDDNNNNNNNNDDMGRMIVDWQVLVHDADVQATRVEFANNSTLVMVHDARVTTTDDWPSLLTQATGGWWLTDFDALILGLFNDCTTELRSHAYECASLNALLFRHMVEWYGPRGPILFVSEMAATRVDESNEVRDWIRYYRDTVGRKTMWFINGRRYISEIHLEGAAAHGGAANATTWTVDALNGGSLARALPRCQGAYGGHADLLAWDVTEFLYHHLV